MKTQLRRFRPVVFQQVIIPVDSFLLPAGDGNGLQTLWSLFGFIAGNHRGRLNLFFSLSLSFSFLFLFFSIIFFLFFSTILFWNYKTENSSSHLLLLSSSSRSIRNDLLGVADAREGSATRWNISSIFSLDFSLFVRLVPPNRISFE